MLTGRKIVVGRSTATRFGHALPQQQRVLRRPSVSPTQKRFRPQSALARPSAGGTVAERGSSAIVRASTASQRRGQSRRAVLGLSRLGKGRSAGTTRHAETTKEKGQTIALQERRRIMGDSHIMAPASMPKIVPLTGQAVAQPLERRRRSCRRRSN